MTEADTRRKRAALLPPRIQSKKTRTSEGEEYSGSVRRLRMSGSAASANSAAGRPGRVL
jgi:hypothetical protein